MALRDGGQVAHQARRRVPVRPLPRPHHVGDLPEACGIQLAWALLGQAPDAVVVAGGGYTKKKL
eukprot:14918500-Alexandrium_andersonii.AAC.1